MGTWMLIIMNVSAFKDKIYGFIATYKWLLIPAIPLLLFIGLLIYISQPQTPVQKSTPETSNTTFTPTTLPGQTRPSSQPSMTILPIPSINFDQIEYETELEAPINTLPGFQESETLPNGLVKHTLASINPSRPNIYITQGNNILLERKITTADSAAQISHFTESYGNPEYKIIGSSFFGPNAEEYIYANLGIAFVANSQTGSVLETRLFPPMTVDDYIKYIKIYE